MSTLDGMIVEWFNTGFGSNDPTLMIVSQIVMILLSFVLTCLYAGLLGYEREYHGHSAGLRTHLLVAIGACAVMLISIYGFGYWDKTYLSAGVSRDPARLAAQVVSGIGFLGAGTIIQNGISVRGLTTATSLWVSMAIGLACGSGSFVIATIACVLAFVCLIFVRRIEKIANKKHPVLNLIVPADQPMMKEVLLLADRFNIKVHETFTELVTYQDQSALRVVLSCGYVPESSLTNFVEEIRTNVHPLELKISNNN